MAIEIKNTEGLSPEIIRAEVKNGGKFLQFDYTISIVVMTFKSTGIYFIRHDQSHWKHSWPYTLCSLVIGWWGIPWGFIYTPMSLFTNLKGGRDRDSRAAALCGQQREPRGNVRDGQAALVRGHNIVPIHTHSGTRTHDTIDVQRIVDWIVYGLRAHDEQGGESHIRTRWSDLNLQVTEPAQEDHLEERGTDQRGRARWTSHHEGRKRAARCAARDHR